MVPLTVTVHRALNPFVLFAVIIAFPADLAITFPLEVTVATFVLLDVNLGLEVFFEG